MAILSVERMMPREIQLHSTTREYGWATGVQDDKQYLAELGLKSVPLKFISNVRPVTARSLIYALSPFESLKVKSVVLSQETGSGCQPCGRICSAVASPTWGQTPSQEH